MFIFISIPTKNSGPYYQVRTSDTFENRRQPYMLSTLIQKRGNELSFKRSRADRSFFIFQKTCEGLLS